MGLSLVCYTISIGMQVSVFQKLQSLIPTQYSPLSNLLNISDPFIYACTMIFGENWHIYTFVQRGLDVLKYYARVHL